MSDLQDKKSKKKKSSKSADGKAKNEKEVPKEGEDNKPQEVAQEDEKVPQSEATNDESKPESTTNGSGKPSEQKPEVIEEDNEDAPDAVTGNDLSSKIARKDSTKAQLDKNPPAPATPAKEEKDIIREIDIRKLSELKEAFSLFDINHDGILDLEDLKYTFATLGKPDIPEEQLQQMLDEMPGPVDFDAFVILFGHKFTQLDPESVFTEALATWDKEGKGYISEERIKDDLRRFGDRFTPTEIDRALEEAPVYVQEGTPMIDYMMFSSNVCGLRNVEKTRKFQKTVESGET